MPKTSGSCMYIIFIYFLSHPGTWLSAARACACLRGDWAGKFALLKL